MRILVTALIVTVALPAAAAPRFEDVSSRLPAKPTPGHTMSAKAADLNGDGIVDLFLAMEREPNRLLLCAVAARAARQRGRGDLRRRRRPRPRHCHRE
jgi:hypothetical protein